jgi:hypothetical protein
MYLEFFLLNTFYFVNDFGLYFMSLGFVWIDEIERSGIRWNKMEWNGAEWCRDSIPLFGEII